MVSLRSWSMHKYTTAQSLSMTSQGLLCLSLLFFQYNIMGTGANMLPSAMLLSARAFAEIKLN